MKQERQTLDVERPLREFLYATTTIPNRKLVVLTEVGSFTIKFKPNHNFIKERAKVIDKMLKDDKL